MSSPGPIARFDITGLSFRGEGLGLRPNDNRRWTIPKALPGEMVEAEILPVRRPRALLRSILEASPQRIASRCPQDPRCPGCQLRSLPLELQRAHKSSGWQRLLQRQGIESGGLRVLPGEAQGYRVRTRLQIYQHPAGLVVGMRPLDAWDVEAPPGPDEVIDMGQCPVLAPRLRWAIQRCVEALRALPRFAPKDPREMGIEIELGEASIRYQIEGLTPALADQLAATLHPQGIWAADASQAPEFTIFADQRSLTALPGAWISATLINARLVAERLFAQLEGVKAEAVLEVGCGIGTHTFGLAEGFGTVVGVDSARAAIASAQLNAARFGFDAVELRVGRAFRSLHRLAKACRRFQLVVLHAMREPYGEDTLRWLRPLGVEQVLHVAPTAYALAKDAALLKEHGFALQALDAIDTMPHTYHMMSVARFVRR